jgi:molybdopterin-guanine dinucleotide biosynthesis protein A
MSMHTYPRMAALTGEHWTWSPSAAADDLATPPRRPVGAILLAGGASRRMGFDKATLLVEGRPLAVRLARLLRQVADDVVEVGPGRSGLPAVLEDPPGSGPLSAIAAGWAALRARGWRYPVLVLACDLPLADRAVLELLAGQPGTESVVPAVGGRLQPLCARWSVEDLDASSEAVRAGERSLRHLPAPEHAVILDESALSMVVDLSTLSDVDSPADLDALGIPWHPPSAAGTKFEQAEGTDHPLVDDSSSQPGDRRRAGP